MDELEEDRSEKRQRGCLPGLCNIFRPFHSKDLTSPVLNIGKPESFRCLIHVSVDPNAPFRFRCCSLFILDFQGLPEEWINILKEDEKFSAVESDPLPDVIDIFEYAFPDINRNLDNLTLSSFPQYPSLVCFGDEFVELTIVKDNPFNYIKLLSSKIGKGGFSEVLVPSVSFSDRFHAKVLSDDHDVAVKIIHLDNIQVICTELFVQWVSQQTYIVSLESCYRWKDNIYVRVLFLCELDSYGVYEFW